MSNKTHLVTNAAQCSFPNLFTAKASIEGAKEKYSVTILIPKTDTEEINKINACYDAAIEEGISKKFGGKVPNKAALRPILKDGDEKADTHPEFKGCYLLTATSVNAPQVVDKYLEAITDPKAIVGGDLIRISANLVAYNVGGQKGVSCYLQAAQLISKTDNPFGRSTVQSDFVAIEADNLL